MTLRPPVPALLAILPVLLATPAAAQSFDCRAARQPDELAICQDPDLARLDQQLAMLYRRGVGNLAEEQREQFQRHEVFFLNARRRCGENSHCVAVSYRNRIHELQSMIANAEAEPAGNAIAGDDERSMQTGERRRVELPEKAEGATPERRPEPRAT